MFFLNGIFKTTRLSGLEWALSIIIGSSVLLVSLLTKLISRWVVLGYLRGDSTPRSSRHKAALAMETLPKLSGLMHHPLSVQALFPAPRTNRGGGGGEAPLFPRTRGSVPPALVAVAASPAPRPRQERLEGAEAGGQGCAAPAALWECPGGGHDRLSVACRLELTLSELLTLLDAAIRPCKAGLCLVYPVPLLLYATSAQQDVKQACTSDRGCKRLQEAAGLGRSLGFTKGEYLPWSTAIH